MHKRIIHVLQWQVFTSYFSSGLFFSVPADPGFTGVIEAGEAEFIHEAVAVHILRNKRCHKVFILYRHHKGKTAILEILSVSEKIKNKKCSSGSDPGLDRYILLDSTNHIILSFYATFWTSNRNTQQTAESQRRQRRVKNRHNLQNSSHTNTFIIIPLREAVLLRQSHNLR